MTGTQNHEGIAGMLGAIDYLEWVGRTFGQDYAEKYAGTGTPGASEGIVQDSSGVPRQGRRLRLRQAMRAIRAYEFELSRASAGRIGRRLPA